MSRIRLPLRLAVLAAVALAWGCASTAGDAFGRDRGLEETQRRYTRLVRWSEFDRASEYVAPDARDAFRARASRLAGVRFTDYRVRASDIDGAEGEAHVRMEYKAYRVNSPIETTFEEQQHWSWDETAEAWRVRPTLYERGQRADVPEH